MIFSIKYNKNNNIHDHQIFLDQLNNEIHENRYSTNMRWNYTS